MCGGWGRKAALCGMPRFLRPLGRSQRLRGWGAGRWGACRVLRLAAFLAAFGPLATLAGWGAGAWGACRVLQPAAFLAAFGPLATLAGWDALGREGHAALCSMPRFLRPLGRSQRLRLLCCGTGIWGAAPNPGKGLRPLHPALLSPTLPPYSPTLPPVSSPCAKAPSPPAADPRTSP